MSDLKWYFYYDIDGGWEHSELYEDIESLIVYLGCGKDDAEEIRKFAAKSKSQTDDYEQDFQMYLERHETEKYFDEEVGYYMDGNDKPIFREYPVKLFATCEGA